ncbi:MAG: radical SAM protein [Candidatus Omnitrophica bacterium]|nr:radical SAM protein [Candidatus Omnitrophota bacterium]
MKTELPPLLVPPSYNYMASFLTFACNLKCTYCINHFEQSAINRKMISGKDWVRALNRLVSRPDLPLTLQGGEPSLHPDFIYIINHIKPELNIDILTNLQFDIVRFMNKVTPERVRRDSPYSSIRVSYHPETMDLEDLIKKTVVMLENKYSIGIWAVMHPKYEEHIKDAQERCRKLGIDFRFKEFLGEHNGMLHGNYLYKDACAKTFKKSVQCKTTELLMDSAGSVYRCHADLYSGIYPIGNILDPDFSIGDKYRPCGHFGHCNPCDIKVKTDRFQQFGHTSVEIKFL